MGATGTGGIDWQKMLPELIGIGAQVGGQVYGAKTQAGAIDRAGQIGAQTAQQQLNAILGMYGLNRGDRAPHRAVGVSALNTLQNWRPGGQNALSPVNLSGYKPNQVDLPPQLQALTTGGGNALSPGGGGAYGAPGFGDLSTKGISAGGSWGGAARGAATGAGIGQFAGPVGAGAGAAFGAAIGGLGRRVSPIATLFDQNNQEKSFATQGIERVGPWVWNQILPAVKSGQMTPDQAEQAVNQTLAQWQQSMESVPGFDKNVLQRSVTSQRGYLEPFFQEMQRLRGGQQPAVA